MDKKELLILKPFVKATFETGLQLDVLAIVYKQSNLDFSCSQIAGLLNDSEENVLHILRKFEKHGLVQLKSSHSVRYSPKNTLTSALTNLLMKNFPKQRLQITRLIYED